MKNDRESDLNLIQMQVTGDIYLTGEILQMFTEQTVIVFIIIDF